MLGTPIYDYLKHTYRSIMSKISDGFIAMQQNRLVKICKLYFVIWGRLGKDMRLIKPWGGKRRVIKKYNF